MAVGGDEHARPELDAIGGARDRGHARHRVVERELGHHGVGPVGRVRVLRLEVGRREEMVEQPHRVEAQFLGGTRHLEDVGAFGEGTGVGQMQSEVHKHGNLRLR